MTSVRGDLEVDDDARREAFMRKVIRAEMRAGRERLAFVCGAYHAPALDPASFPPVSHDNALIEQAAQGQGGGDLGAVELRAAVVREWLRRRRPLAGVVPAPLRHARRRGRPVVVRPRGTGPARTRASTRRPPRSSRPPASPSALAAVRGRPSVGLSELTDAAARRAHRGRRPAAAPRRPHARHRRGARPGPRVDADGAARQLTSPGSRGRCGSRRLPPRPSSSSTCAASRSSPGRCCCTGSRCSTCTGARRSTPGRSTRHLQGGVGARVDTRARRRRHRGEPLRHDGAQCRRGQGVRGGRGGHRPRRARQPHRAVPARRPARRSPSRRRRPRRPHRPAARHPEPARDRRAAGADVPLRRRARRRRRRRDARPADRRRAGLRRPARRLLQPRRRQRGPHAHRGRGRAPRHRPRRPRRPARAVARGTARRRARRGDPRRRVRPGQPAAPRRRAARRTTRPRPA